MTPNTPKTEEQERLDVADGICRLVRLTPEGRFYLAYRTKALDILSSRDELMKNRGAVEEWSRFEEEIKRCHLPPLDRKRLLVKVISARQMRIEELEREIAAIKAKM